MKQLFSMSWILIAALLLAGCPSTNEVRKETPKPAPPKEAKKPALPEINVIVASLNLTKLSKRIERKEIEELANFLKKEKVDILTMQGISRYPGVTTRIDILEELSRDADMRSMFGETISLSGKQNGNAILSYYPITSSENTHYDGIQSTNFESALQAVVDCGTREVVFISTNLPEKSSLEDQTTCINRLSSFNILYINRPLIIAGNMPRSEDVREVVAFDGTKPEREQDAPRIWFSNDGSVKLLHEKVEHTPFGSMTVAQFGIFRKK